jgi:hypothetical protein
MVTWRVGVVGGCDVAYAGAFSGDVAVSDVAYRLPTSLDEGRGKRGGLSTDGEVEGGAGDVVQWAGVGVSDERALAWPMWALARGSGDGGGGGCGLVVVRGRRVMVQCLATGG